MECQRHVTGYSGAQYKSFKSRIDAEHYYHRHTPPQSHRAPVASAASTAPSTAVASRRAPNSNSRSDVNENTNTTNTTTTNDDNGVDTGAFRGMRGTMTCTDSDTDIRFNFVFYKPTSRNDDDGSSNERSPRPLDIITTVPLPTTTNTATAFESSTIPDAVGSCITTTTNTNMNTTTSTTGSTSIPSNLPVPNNHQQQQQQPNNKILSIHIMFDGGSRGNPGAIAGAGAVVSIHTKTTSAFNSDPNTTTTATTTYRIRQFLGNPGASTQKSLLITNNQAEYSGIQIGLRVALFHIQQEQRLQSCNRHERSTGGSSTSTSSDHGIVIESIHIQGDSQLIIHQLNRLYVCRNAQLKVYYEKCQHYIQQLVALSPRGDKRNVLVMEHVYRNQNQDADGNVPCYC